jgi:hypothetical protein
MRNQRRHFKHFQALSDLNRRDRESLPKAAYPLSTKAQEGFNRPLTTRAMGHLFAATKPKKHMPNAEHAHVVASEPLSLNDRERDDETRRPHRPFSIIK